MKTVPVYEGKILLKASPSEMLPRAALINWDWRECSNLGGLGAAFDSCYHVSNSKNTSLVPLFCHVKNKHGSALD